MGEGNGNGNGNGQAASWWVNQLRIVVGTVGVPGLFGLLILWGIWDIGKRVVSVFSHAAQRLEPHAEDALIEHTKFLRGVGEATRLQTERVERQTEILQQQTEITQELVKIGRDSNRSIGQVHDRLEKIEEAVGVTKGEGDDGG